MRTERSRLLLLLLTMLVVCGSARAGEGSRVTASDGVVTRETILASARELFATEREGDVVIEPLQVPVSLNLRGTNCRILAPAEACSTVTGSVRLALVEEIDGAQRHLAWVTLAVRRFAPVLVAARAIALHEAPLADDIRLERRETTLMGRGILSDPDWLLGKRTRRIVGEGSVLFESMFEEAPAVLHGQQLTLRVLAGSVTLTLPVVARQDGRLGESISVQKVGSSERLMARVASERTVEIVVH